MEVAPALNVPFVWPSTAPESRFLRQVLLFIGEPSPFLESVYAHFDNDLMRLVIWANQASATQFAQIAPLVIEHVKRQTPLAVTLIRQAAGEIDRLGSALAAQSLNKNLPCSLLGGLAQFIEPWLGDSLQSRLVPCESDSVSGVLLMIRKAVWDQPLARPVANRRNNDREQSLPSFC